MGKSLKLEITYMPWKYEMTAKRKGEESWFPELQSRRELISRTSRIAALINSNWSLQHEENWRTWIPQPY